MPPLRVAIVGAGHRALSYAQYAQREPSAMQITAVADPDPHRRQYVAEQYHLPPERCFPDAATLARHPEIADAAINGTMDRQHVPTSLPLLDAGWHLLLEKPFAVNEDEMWELVRAARKRQREIMICHVLRYAPFYQEFRKRLAAGLIGDIVSLQTIEQVSYHHMAVGYIRGKWNSEAGCGSPMLMAKCCHDLDLLMWMKSGIAPRRVASFGGRHFFRQEKAPAGAGTRCLTDCPIEATCPYSARKHYLDHPGRWTFYVWAELESLGRPPTQAEMEASLRTSPFGRCVWRCDNDVVDRQSVTIEFADGAVATHMMVGGAARPQRSIHVVGTNGEIQGVFDESRFVIRHIDPRPGREYSEEVVDLNVTGDMHGAAGGHGGGDALLIEDFVKVLRGEQPSPSCTKVQDSVYGHLTGFRADTAMKERRVVEIEEGIFA